MPGSLAPRSSTYSGPQQTSSQSALVQTQELSALGSQSALVQPSEPRVQTQLLHPHDARSRVAAMVHARGHAHRSIAACSGGGVWAIIYCMQHGAPCRGIHRTHRTTVDSLVTAVVAGLHPCITHTYDDCHQARATAVWGRRSTVSYIRGLTQQPCTVPQASSLELLLITG